MSLAVLLVITKPLPNPSEPQTELLEPQNEPLLNLYETFSEPLPNLPRISPESPLNLSQASLRLAQLNFLIVLSRLAIWYPT